MCIGLYITNVACNIVLFKEPGCCYCWLWIYGFLVFGADSGSKPRWYFPVHCLLCLYISLLWTSRQQFLAAAHELELEYVYFFFSGISQVLTSLLSSSCFFLSPPCFFFFFVAASSHLCLLLLHILFFKICFFTFLFAVPGHICLLFLHTCFSCVFNLC